MHLEENPLKYVWKARFEIFKTEPESIDPPYFKISNTTELKELITKVFPLESPSRISSDVDKMVNKKFIDPSSEIYIIFYPA